MLLLYRRVLLGEAARSLNKASFTWLPMIQAEVKGMTRFRRYCCLFPGVLAKAPLHSAVQEGVRCHSCI